MIYWEGKQYPLIQQHYNGAVLGYLLDGMFLLTCPKGVLQRGYIAVEDGVIVILRRSVWPAILPAVFLLLVVLWWSWPRPDYVYYQVTFAERPLLQDGVLYCNVINEAGISVTVQFLNGTNKTMAYTLAPGEALPYIYMDFVPDIIRYNGLFTGGTK